MAIKIKLMADYACDPLWWSGDGRVGNIDPGTLPLSQETISRLEKWADANDATLNRDDPGNSPGFPSKEAEDTFEAEGISLWKQLRQELSPIMKCFTLAIALVNSLPIPAN